MDDAAALFRLLGDDARLRLLRLLALESLARDVDAGLAVRETDDAVSALEARNMVLVARMIVTAALARTESRGAHQREDFPGMLPEWQVNQRARLRDGRVSLDSAPVAAAVAAQ